MVNLVAASLGPKHCMAIPCYATKETVKHHGPSYHTDLAVHKIHDDNSTYIRVATGSSSIIMIVELKMNVPNSILTVPLKDILELLVYVRCDGRQYDKDLWALSDTKSWHCFNAKLNENKKLEIFDYVHHFAEDETSHLGFLPSLVEYLDLA